MKKSSFAKLVMLLLAGMILSGCFVAAGPEHNHWRDHDRYRDGHDRDRDRDHDHGDRHDYRGPGYY